MPGSTCSSAPGPPGPPRTARSPTPSSGAAVTWRPGPTVATRSWLRSPPCPRWWPTSAGRSTPCAGRAARRWRSWRRPAWPGSPSAARCTTAPPMPWPRPPAPCTPNCSHPCGPARMAPVCGRWRHRLQTPGPGWAGLGRRAARPGEDGGMAAEQPGYRLYQDLAAWWPLISPPEEYADEAAFAARVLNQAGLPVREVLELGSGGGHCASHLTPGFTMTLVDLSAGMLAVSRRLNPDCAHVEADMRTVRLGRDFDAVFVHDAVDYMTTE